MYAVNSVVQFSVVKHRYKCSIRKCGMWWRHLLLISFVQILGEMYFLKVYWIFDRPSYREILNEVRTLYISNVIQLTTLSTTLHYSVNYQKQMFFKMGILKNLANFTGKHLCWSLFLIKLQAFQACNFIKKRLQHRCFPMKFAKFIRTPFLKEHLRWLLLKLPKNH